MEGGGSRDGGGQQWISVGNARRPYRGFGRWLGARPPPLDIFFPIFPPPTTLAPDILAHWNRGLAVDLARVQLARNFL